MQWSKHGKAQLAGLYIIPVRMRGLVFLTGLMMAIALTAVFGADAIPASSPDLHTFTNPDGKTIKAVIFSAAQDYVFLKRDDGQTFKVPVSTLSKDDQNFIRQWIIKQAQARGDDILTVSIASVRGDSESPAVSTKTVITTAWSEYYKIKVANATTVNWSNLQLQYIIFYQITTPDVLPPGNVKPAHASGKITLGDVPGEQDKTVATDKIDLKATALAPNAIYSNGAPAKTSDELQGVWVRIYDENNNLVQEWASPHDLMKNNNWDALSPPARGGRRGGRGNARGAPAAGAN